MRAAVTWLDANPTGTPTIGTRDLRCREFSAVGSDYIVTAIAGVGLVEVDPSAENINLYPIGPSGTPGERLRAAFLVDLMSEWSPDAQVNNTLAGPAN